MVRVVLLLTVLFISCLAAPSERVRRNSHHDYGLGVFGLGGGYGGYGHHGQYGGGVGYGGGHTASIPVASQSFSKSSASSSSVSTGGGFAG